MICIKDSTNYKSIFNLHEQETSLCLHETPVELGMVTKVCVYCLSAVFVFFLSILYCKYYLVKAPTENNDWRFVTLWTYYPLQASAVSDLAVQFWGNMYAATRIQSLFP